MDTYELYLLPVVSAFLVCMLQLTDPRYPSRQSLVCVRELHFSVIAFLNPALLCSLWKRVWVATWICSLPGGNSFGSNKCFLFFMKPESLLWETDE